MVSNAIPAEELSVTDTQESEIIGVKPTLPDQPLILYNCYSPPNKALMLDAMDIPMTADCIVVGDFNSRSPSWGYKDLDTKGEELEDWQIYNTLHLLNRPDDPPTFCSRAWKTTHPDLAFVTSNISRGAERKVLEQLATSDHKPVLI